MTRVRSLIFIGAGALLLGNGVYGHYTRYSRDNVFERQNGRIEYQYRMEARESVQGATRARESRIAELDRGLDAMEGASAERMCMFERRFEESLRSTDPASVLRGVENETYVPGSQCGTSAQITKTAKELYAPFGLGLLLLGIYGFIRKTILRRGENSPLGREGEKKRAKMERERRDALQTYGLSPADAFTVAKESIRVQSVNDALYGNHTARGVISVLESYGFYKDEVQRVLVAFPPVLNRPPEALTSSLKELEREHGTPEAVRETVLRLPGVLG